MTHSIFIFFCKGGGNHYSRVSIHHTRRAWTGGAGCSALCWWPLLRAANWKPCVMHKSVTSTEMYTDGRTRGVQQANQSDATIVLVWIYPSMRMSISCILSPHDCYMCTWRTCWACLYEINLVAMPRGCEAIVFSCEHLWGMVRPEFSWAWAWRDALPILVLMLLRGICDVSWQAEQSRRGALKVSHLVSHLTRLPSSLVCSDLFGPILVASIFF